MHFRDDLLSRLLRRNRRRCGYDVRRAPQAGLDFHLCQTVTRSRKSTAVTSEDRFRRITVS
jgi:hypothetical protein